MKTWGENLHLLPEGARRSRRLKVVASHTRRLLLRLGATAADVLSRNRRPRIAGLQAALAGFMPS
jgi:hypothetical protein